MGLFSIFTRPYTQAIRSVSSAGKRMKGRIDGVSELIEGKKNNESIHYVEAEDAKAAFEMLFVENGWTEKELAEKVIYLRRSRFIMLGFSWFTFMVAVFLFAYYLGVNWLLSYIFPLFFLSVSFSCLLAALRYSVYHEQLTQRSLITFRKYLKEGGFIRKTFG